MRSIIRVAPDVGNALSTNQPVVALESSVLAQGLPIPANRQASARMASAIVSRGGVSAITAVARGVPTVGLAGADLERFLAREGVHKVSARDLPVAMSLGADGATTVAATLCLAHAVGIRVFATGGIGGVHRAPPRSVAPQPRDESADLVELSRTPLVVVCAGAKSILDLPATWERLETLGIPVVGFRTSQLPGFFTAETGITLDTTVDSVGEIGAIFRAHRSLGRTQALLVVQPPPTAHALRGNEVETAVERALAEAENMGVRGASVTPFLLEAVSRLTEGRSLEANLSLLEQNAALAAEIARAACESPAPEHEQPAEV
ncbi:MAG TPA: pseudouridine-5'-phosphate glycosidase [Gemmatimonadaceae bacterium]|nr:pseudouridine-5'-phosphate glycosidase [Gemmatimonadaceae bacterium]